MRCILLSLFCLGFHFYRPPTKLPESNVFTRVCLSVHGGGGPMWPLPMMHWSSLYRPPLPCPGPLSASDIFWLSLVVSSNLFTWGTAPNWYWHLVATEVHSVGKRAIRILLECFLVIVTFGNYGPICSNSINCWEIFAFLSTPKLATGFASKSLLLY